MNTQQILNANGFNTSIGNHGLIFVTPINKGNIFPRFFNNYDEALLHYTNAGFISL